MQVLLKFGIRKVVRYSIKFGKKFKNAHFLAVFIFTHMLISIQMTTFENQLAGKIFFRKSILKYVLILRQSGM